MHGRFTDGVRRALVLAQEEAASLEHHLVGTEHVLLGLLSEGDGVAAAALRTLGVGGGSVREIIEEESWPSRPAATSTLEFTPRAVEVFKLALREALPRDEGWIDTEHILLGIVREGAGKAVRALVALGVDLDRVRPTVAELVMARLPPAEGATPAAPAEVPPQPAEATPRCLGCRGELVETVRYRSIRVLSAAGEARRDRLDAREVYCGRCGTNLGLADPTPPDRAGRPSRPNDEPPTAT